MGNALYPSLPGLTWDTTKAPMFNVIVQTAASGAELRGTFQSAPIYDVVLAYDLLRDGGAWTELKTLLGFFLARNGSFDSFLYLDADDSLALAQSFGTGDGVTLQFQLARSMGAFTEPCSNIATGPSIYVAGVLQTSGYTVGPTGIVSFTSPPANGAALTWSGTYYMRSRFMTDNTPLTFNQFASKLWETKTVEFYGSFGTKI